MICDFAAANILCSSVRETRNAFEPQNNLMLVNVSLASNELCLVFAVTMDSAQDARSASYLPQRLESGRCKHFLACGSSGIHASIQYNREDSVSSSSHIPSSTGKLAAMYSHKRKSSLRFKSFTGVFSEREGTFAEHRQVRDRNIVRHHFLSPIRNDCANQSYCKFFQF